MASIFRQVRNFARFARDAAEIARTAVTILDKVTEVAEVASGRRVIETKKPDPIKIEFQKDPKTGEYVGKTVERDHA